MRLSEVSYSPYREDYQKLRRQGLKVAEIYRIAVDKNKETFSYKSLARYLKNTIEGEVVESGKLKKKVLTEEFKSIINVIRKLTGTLEICNSKISGLMVEDLSPDREKILIQYLGEARLTSRELREWIKAHPKIVPEEGGIFEKIIYCFNHLSPKDLEEFQRKWTECESLSQEELEEKIRSEYTRSKYP